MFRRALGLIGEMVGRHPGPFAISVVGAAIFSGATVATTVVLGRLTDRLVFPTFENGEMAADAWKWGIAAVLAVTLFRAIGVICRRFFAGLTADRNQRTYHRALADKYLSMPMSWFHRNPTGRLLAHADSDVEVTTQMLHALPLSIGVLSLAVFASISMFVVDWFLALVAFAVFPALAFLNRYYTRRIERPAAEVQRGIGQVASIAHESFDGALVVKTLGRSEAEKRRFDDAVQTLRADRVEVGYTRAVFNPVLDALPNLGIVVVVVIGAFRIDAGAITIGDLIQVSALFIVLAFPMRVFGFFLESLPPALVARERLEGVLSAVEPEPPTEVRTLPDGPLAVVADGVSYRYRSRLDTEAVDELWVDDGDEPSLGPRVLSTVDLELAPGEVVALVGSTGSGKSTLCLVLAGLLPPSGGSVEVGGQPIELIQPERRTDAVAVVFQESFLFADTLRANVDLTGGQVAESRILEAAAIAQVDEFVDDMPQGWETIVGERGVTLSGGQRQRVALARALIRRPRFLILDDATSAVDPKIELRILQGLRGRTSQSDEATPASPTTLIVAQRVSTIELADRVLYLDGGTIVAAGPHRELMARPDYRSLVEAYEMARQ